MKANTHPNWHNNTTVTCVCGHTFSTGSLQDAIQVDICSNCHPFFTKEERFVDRAGRVDFFKQKMERAQAMQQTRGTRKKTNSKTETKSFKDLLAEQKQNLAA